MFCSERALRMVYKNFNLLFIDLLRKDNAYSIYHRNIQSLTTELCKVKNHLSNQIMYNIFENQNILYNLKAQSSISLTGVSSAFYGLNLLFYFAGLVCDHLEIKECQSIEPFKTKIRD